VFSGNVFFSGDEAAAQALLPEALQCANIAASLRSSLGLAEYEKIFDLPFGNVRVVVAENNSAIYITAQPRPTEPSELAQLLQDEVIFYELHLPWRPEGMVLTPVSAAEPDGIGLPMRAGTPDATVITDQNGYVQYTSGGVLPQVLINNYRNNKYMDDLQYVGGIPEGLETLTPTATWRTNDSYNLDTNTGDPLPWPLDREIRYSTAPIFGQPHSFNDGQSNTPADWFDFNEGTIPELGGGLFAAIRVGADSQSASSEPEVITTKVLDASAFSEPEATEYYAHRPEELLYTSLVKEGIFQKTNFYRTENSSGLIPFYRPLRGDGETGDAGTYYMGLVNPPRYFGHSHYDWMPGFRTAAGRHIAHSGQEWGLPYADNPVENALLVQYYNDLGNGQLGIGEWLTDFWRNSPGHYAAIVSTNWDTRGFLSLLDVFEKHTAHPSASYFLVKGASLNVGGSEHSGTVNTIFDVNAVPGQYWNELPPSSPIQDEPGLSVWSENFCQRLTWVPTPDVTVNTYAGGVGMYNSPNPHYCYPAYQIRRFSLGTRFYELPPHNAPFYTGQLNQTFPDADLATDEFMCVAGAHPFEKDGQTWIRVVYWETDAVPQYINYQTNNSYTGPLVLGTHAKVIVAVFPAALSESYDLPWRTPETQGVSWGIEDEYDFTIANGFVPQWAGTVEFSSDGNKFCFTAYELSSNSVTTQYDRVAANFTDPASQTTLPYTQRAAIPRTVEYNATSGFTFQPQQTPVTNVVSAATTDVGATFSAGGDTYHLVKNQYTQAAQGSYNIFPHYDDADQLQHVQSVIDFYGYQYGYADFRYGHLLHNQSTTGMDHYMWAQQKLVFPSGKEFVYFQANKTVPPLPTVTSSGPVSVQYYDTSTPHANSPYTTGGNFVCYISSLNPKTEEISYVRNTSHRYKWTYSSVDYDIILFDSSVEQDLGDGVTDVLWTKTHTAPVSGGAVWAHGDYAGHEFWEESLLDGRTGTDLRNEFVYEWGPFYNDRLYNLSEIHFTTPITLTNASSDYVRVTISKLMGEPTREYVNYHEIRSVVGGTAPQFPFVELTARSAPSDTVMYTLERRYPGNHELSCVPSRWVTAQSEDFSLHRVQVGGQCASPASLLPPLLPPTQTTSRVLTYKERQLTRFNSYDMPYVGPIPENVVYLAGAPSSYTYGEYRPDPSGDPLLVIEANFDLDSAAGLTGVTDVFPCGVIY